MKLINFTEYFIMFGEAGVLYDDNDNVFDYNNAEVKRSLLNRERFTDKYINAFNKIQAKSNNRWFETNGSDAKSDLAIKRAVKDQANKDYDAVKSINTEVNLIKSAIDGYYNTRDVKNVGTRGIDKSTIRSALNSISNSMTSLKRNVDKRNNEYNGAVSKYSGNHLYSKENISELKSLRNKVAEKAKHIYGLKSHEINPLTIANYNAAIKDLDSIKNAIDQIMISITN